MRPEVVIVMVASVDGRITTGPGRNVTEWAAHGLTGAEDFASRLCDRLDCDGLVSGSESVLVWGSHPVVRETPGYWPQTAKAYIVFDGRGRVDWTQTEGLLVVTRSDVPTAYRAQLAQKNIDAVYAGSGEHISLPEALAQLYERGFRRLALTGGGQINGAFLRSGLVDELAIVWSPLLVGGETTPTIYDAPDLSDWRDILRLELLRAEVVGEILWAHYKVGGRASTS
jgi:riboflavin biosynthesis pyrimidine reductase